MESNLYSNVQALLKEIISKRASQKVPKAIFLLNACKKLVKGQKKLGKMGGKFLKELHHANISQGWTLNSRETGTVWKGNNLDPYDGKLRWTLEKKLDGSPSSSIVLIHLVLKELENCFVSTEGSINRVFKTESLINVIPLVHTLYYAVIQSSAVIPTELFHNMHECLMKLMILPPPFSSVAMAMLRSIKMETTTPGCLYHSRVALEQNLKTEREKVFVLADPAVCSEVLQKAIQEHLGVSHVLRDKAAVQMNVILHVLQAGLGMQCHSSKVSQALKILGDQWTEKYFQQLSEVIEDCIKQGADGRVYYLNKLKNIHCDILTASTEEVIPEDQDPTCASPMPSPDIQFVVWHNDDDLWDLLLNFSLRSDPNSCVNEGSRDRDLFESEESRKQTCLCCDGENSPTRKPSPAFSRRKAFKNLKSADKVTLLREKMEAFNGSCALLETNSRRDMARVVVMGDDRVLGRLARAYHAIRERESKRLILTKMLNLRFYYIPLAHVGTPPETACRPRLDASVFSLSSFLGQVDPWYDSNINGLQTSITKLYEMHCKNIKPSKHNLFLLDTLCYYLRCGSHHVKLPLYSVKMTRSTSEGNSVVDEMFVSRLDADIPEFKHLKEKSPEMQFAARGKKPSGHGASLSISYARTSLSKRQDVKGEASMAYGVVITSEPKAASSGENYLSVKFDYMNPECRNTEIRTKSLIIKTVASRTLSVRLDQDSRRTYRDIQRVDISLCVDPGNKIRSSFGGSIQSEPALSQYLDKVLLLPINTFSSLTP